MEDDNEIDQLFKNGLTEPDIPFNESDWKKMEQKLDAKSRRKVVPLWIVKATGLVAAIVLLVLLFFPKADNPSGRLKISEQPKKVPAILPVPDWGEAKQPSVAGPEPVMLSQFKKTVAPVSAQLNKQPGLSPVPYITPNAYLPVMPKLNQAALPEPADSAAVLARKANALANSKEPGHSQRYPHKIEEAELNKSIRKSMDGSAMLHHALVLTALAAPDVSTAKSSKSSKLSSNIGMLATYAVGKKLSVTSGAIYARKFYNSEGTTGSSYGNAADTWEVYADCNVLDVPLNVNYKLITGKKSSVSFSTGLSTYFMLKEKYDYVTQQADGTQKVTTLEIRNQNQHLLGIANVGVSFDHRLTEKISIGVQPFAKLPLTGIGYGNASLRSAGVSFSLNIGLFPAKKPGSYVALR
jgi:hypothetical protein